MVGYWDGVDAVNLKNIVGIVDGYSSVNDLDTGIHELFPALVGFEDTSVLRFHPVFGNADESFKKAFDESFNKAAGESFDKVHTSRFNAAMDAAERALPRVGY